MLESVETYAQERSFGKEYLAHFQDFKIFSLFHEESSSRISIYHVYNLHTIITWFVTESNKVKAHQNDKGTTIKFQLKSEGLDCFIFR